MKGRIEANPWNTTAGQSATRTDHNREKWKQDALRFACACTKVHRRRSHASRSFATLTTLRRTRGGFKSISLSQRPSCTQATILDRGGSSEVNAS